MTSLCGESSGQMGLLTLRYGAWRLVIRLPRPPPSTVAMRSLLAEPTTADRHARKW